MSVRRASDRGGVAAIPEDGRHRAAGEAPIHPTNRQKPLPDHGKVRNEQESPVLFASRNEATRFLRNEAIVKSEISFPRSSVGTRKTLRPICGGVQREVSKNSSKKSVDSLSGISLFLSWSSWRLGRSTPRISSEFHDHRGIHQAPKDFASRPTLSEFRDENKWFVTTSIRLRVLR